MIGAISLLCLCLSACLLTCVEAGSSTSPQGWQAAKLPNPVLDPKGCGRLNPGRVCDPDGVLSTRTRDEVQAVLAEIEDTCKHHCDSLGMVGYQVAVVVVEKISDYEVHGDDRTLTGMTFARTVGDTWGVGHRACNDGVIFFFSVTDRTFAIVTGQGAQEALSDQQSGLILDRLKPSLKDEEYDKAADAGVLLIRQVLQGHKLVETPWYRSVIWILAVLAVVLFLPCLCGILGMVGVAFLQLGARMLDLCCACCSLCRRTEVQPERPVGEQQLLKRIEEDLDRDDSDPGMCAICLEDLTPPTTEQTPLTQGGILVLPCSHRFHSACVEKWLRRTPQCPMCRALVPDGFDTASHDVENAQRPPSPNSGATAKLSYSERLQFYLARLEERSNGNPMATQGSAQWSEHSAREYAQMRSRGLSWSDQAWRDLYIYDSVYDLNRRPAATMTYADYVPTFESVFNHSASLQRSWVSTTFNSGGSGGSSGSSMGGGGFSGGGGAGGGW